MPLAIAMLVAAATFGLPLGLGLAWVPLPIGLEAPPGPAPRFQYAADAWTFPHVTWPWRRLEAAALANGRIPWWNPYLSLGAPLAGQLENQLFFPLKLLEMFLGPPAWNVNLLLKMAVAGLGAYTLAR